MSNLLARQLEAISRSGLVRRYHTETLLHPQTVGEHTYGVLWLVLKICKIAPSANLLIAALMHDTPEYVVGDVPSPIKRQGGIAPAFDALEDEVMDGLEFFCPKDLSNSEKAILKWADTLEGCLFCLNELQRGNSRLEQVFKNYLIYAEALPLNDIALSILNQIRSDYVKLKG